MRRRWPGLAATYVGTVVGAGFASGQEIQQFFARYGARGLLGVALAGALFAALGAATLHRIRQAGHRHYGSLLRDVCGPLVGGALDWLGILGLAVALAAVLAAAGALARDLLGWTRPAGCAALAAALCACALGGRRALVDLNLVAVPCIVGAALLAGVHALAQPHWSMPEDPAALPWTASAVLYVAYNLLLGVAGLCAACDGGETRADSFLGGMAGGLALTLLCAATTAALLAAPAAEHLGDLPLAGAVRAAYWRRAVYPGLLLLSLWTTGAAASVALGQRLRPRAPWPVAAAAPLVVLPVALLGLPAIVARLYPVVGLGGLPLLVGLVLAPFRGTPPRLGKRAAHR